MRKIWVVLLVMCAFSAVKAEAKTKSLPPMVKRAVNAVMAGSPAPLKGYLTPQMAEGLTPEAMQAVKQQVAPLGALRSVDVTSTKKVQGMNVTLFVMHLAKGNLNGQMAQDSSGKVAGLFVRPAAG